MDDKDFNIKMKTAVSLESMGRIREAEDVILEVIAKCDSSKKELIGSLHLDLGDIAEKDNRIEDSINYYKKATQLLKGAKGESMLQLAHAHFNLARIYLFDQINESCLHESTRALELYEKYPFTSPKDVTDARLLNTVSRALINKQVEFKEFEAMWQEISHLKFSDLNARNMAIFFYLYIIHSRKMNIPLKNFLKQVKKWAGRRFIKFVLKDVERALKSEK